MHNPVTVTMLDWASARCEAQPIRYAVFVNEQAVPAELEIDEQDIRCVHAIARAAGGLAIGTGRLLPGVREGSDTLARIGRMAVLKNWRGKGVGTAMLAALIEVARRRGDSVLALSAQTHAVGFYRGFGFVEEGEEYLEAGIVHQLMRRAL